MNADPFCVKEQTDRTKFYESEHFMLLYDIRPVIEGHFLIVPKRHVMDLVELSAEEFKELHLIFKEAVPRVLKLYGATDGSYDIISQVGAYSGRTVSHLHIHVLPRKKDDKYQGNDSNIYSDIKYDSSRFTIKDVEREVAKLRKEFRYKQG